MRLSYLAFLDVVCCGFGAAILLFLLAVASMREVQSTRPDDSLLVVCKPVSGGRAEVGIELLPPGERLWIRPRTYVSGDRLYFVPPRTDGDVGAFIAIARPAPGTWHFRPYLADFPEPTGPNGDRPEIAVRLRIYGRYQWNSDQETPILMNLPGDHGQSISVAVTE